jgi:hypothetical protein
VEARDNAGQGAELTHLMRRVFSMSVVISWLASHFMVFARFSSYGDESIMVYVELL